MKQESSQIPRFFSKEKQAKMIRLLETVRIFYFAVKDDGSWDRGGYRLQKQEKEWHAASVANGQWKRCNNRPQINRHNWCRQEATTGKRGLKKRRSAGLAIKSLSMKSVCLEQYESADSLG